MVCFSEGGHYLGFFRRIAIKMSYLVSAENSDQSSFQKQWYALKREANSQQEWVQYNDTELKFITDNWPAVIERCIEQNFYPTILFYEKLHDCEEDTDYTKSKEFNIKPSQLRQMSELAAQMDLFASQNMEDIYGDDEIQRQIEIEKELMESFKKSKGGEESKEESKQLPDQQENSPKLEREENKGQKVDEPSAPSVPVKPLPLASARASNTSNLAQLLKSSRIELLYTLFWIDEEGHLQYKDFDVLKQSTDAYRKLNEFPRVITKMN